jgi:hypothetical protein
VVSNNHTLLKDTNISKTLGVCGTKILKLILQKCLRSTWDVSSATEAEKILEDLRVCGKKIFRRILKNKAGVQWSNFIPRGKHLGRPTGIGMYNIKMNLTEIRQT